MEITKATTIEDLIAAMPHAVSYLMNRGIRCMVCGEPMWGTLESAALEKGFSQTDIARFVAELRSLADAGVVQSDLSRVRAVAGTTLPR